MSKKTPAKAAPMPQPLEKRARVPRILPKPRHEYHAFAKKVREQMQLKGMSASDLARAIWGTALDSRGYEVAKNRDRIGHYLAGISYPEPANLKKLAQALGLPVEDLHVDKEASTPQTAMHNGSTRGLGEVTMMLTDTNPEIAFLAFKKFVMVETALKIIQLLSTDKASSILSEAAVPAPEKTKQAVHA